MIIVNDVLIAFYAPSLEERLRQAKTGDLRELPLYMLNSLKKEYWKLSGRPDVLDFGERLLIEEDDGKRAFLIDRVMRRYFLPEALTYGDEIRKLSAKREELGVDPSGFSKSQGSFNRCVAPYDATLVSRDPYLNANYVFDGSMIVAQAPLLEQTAIFWDMVAAQGVDVVVSLWGADSESYFEYFPSFGEGRHFFEGMGSLECTRQEEWIEWDYSYRDAISLRTLNFHDKWGHSHEIRHIQVHDWRDMGCPSLKTIHKILSLMEGARTPLIHCAAGIGRSGMVAVLAQIKKNPTLSVLEAVRSLRDPLKGRCPEMVEKDEQYFFIYSVLKSL